MAAPGDHLRESDRLEKHAAFYASTFPGEPWEIVFRFYASLHVVQAYLLTKGERFHADSHDTRERAMKAAPELRNKVLADYRRLRDLSEQVRYDPGFKAQPKDHEEAERLQRKIFSIVRPWVDRELGK